MMKRIRIIKIEMIMLLVNAEILILDGPLSLIIDISGRNERIPVTERKNICCNPAISVNGKNRRIFMD